MEPMFTVIVPIYKVEKYLKKCITSILNQTYKDFELLLIDDGSPDNCPKICDEFKRKDKRVKVIHKKNGGLVSARNIGVKNASGKYICYVDGDDWIRPNLLEEVNKIITDNKDLDMVIFNIERVFEDYNQILDFDIENGLYDKQKLEEYIYPFMMYDNRKSFCKGLIFPAACNKIYRKELLEKHHCKDERIKMGEDNAFVFECLVYSNKVYFVNKVFYEYNQLNPTSFNNSYDKNRFENNQLLTSYIEKNIGNYSKTIENQVNAFKTYWLIMAVFHEVKCHRKLFEARKHIKVEIKKNKSLEGISFKGLPIFAKGFLLLLKMHLYTLALIGAKIVNKKRS